MPLKLGKMTGNMIGRHQRQFAANWKHFFIHTTIYSCDGSNITSNYGHFLEFLLEFKAVQARYCCDQNSLQAQLPAVPICPLKRCTTMSKFEVPLLIAFTPESHEIESFGDGCNLQVGDFFSAFDYSLHCLQLVACFVKQ